MPTSELQKKALVFLIISAVAITGLIAMPLFEHWLQAVFFPPLAGNLKTIGNCRQTA